MSTFLGCLKLETGGIIVAWTCLLTNLIAALVNAEYIIAGKTRKQKSDPETANVTNNLFEESARSKFASFFFLLFCVFMIAASFLCIKAVEDKTFKMVSPLIVGACIEFFVCLWKFWENWDNPKVVQIYKGNFWITCCFVLVIFLCFVIQAYFLFTLVILQRNFKIEGEQKFVDYQL